MKYFPKKKKISRNCSKFSTYSKISIGFPIEIFEICGNIAKFVKIWKIFHIFSLFEMDFLWISKMFDFLAREASPLYNKYDMYLRNMLCYRIYGGYMEFPKKSV